VHVRTGPPFARDEDAQKVTDRQVMGKDSRERRGGPAGNETASVPNPYCRCARICDQDTGCDRSL
jgi:hypothetical protein